MHVPLLHNLLDFIAQTGETAAFGHEGRSYVILPMEAYLSRFGAKAGKTSLTEQEVIDRINREIVQWKTSENAETLAIDSNFPHATLEGTSLGEDNNNVNH